jgi:limonene-1,2-epoxide hydrolase
LCRADGSVLVSIPCAGVMTLKDGKIVRFADYYDPREALAIFSPSGNPAK